MTGFVCCLFKRESAIWFQRLRAGRRGKAVVPLVLLACAGGAPLAHGQGGFLMQELDRRQDLLMQEMRERQRRGDDREGEQRVRERREADRTEERRRDELRAIERREAIEESERRERQRRP